MRELLAAGRRQVDAVAAAQLHLLPLDIGAEGVELAALVGEIVEQVEEFGARALGIVFEQLIQRDHLRIELVAAHRRQPDPDDRDMRGAQRRHDRLNALRVNLLPAVG